MTDLPSPAPSSSTFHDELPIALRRARRSCSNQNLLQDSPSKPSRRSNRVFGIETPPATPQRGKKRVRFSDPGPAIAAATGLTPFISRQFSISTPSSNRRHSAPSRWNLAQDYTPLSGTLQFAPLRQVLDGRVKRRIRRNRLSEEINTIEWGKKQEKKAERGEISRLQHALRQKDIELQYLREEQETASQLGGEALTPTARVHDLEAQVAELKAELEKREVSGQDDPNWTMAARDPYDEDAFMQDYDNDFDDGMTEMIISTPLRRSFPSPPATVPNTPSKRPINHTIGIQASLPDPSNQLLQQQLQTLQNELASLTKTLELSTSTHDRLSAKLAPFITPIDACPHESLDFALDSVLTHLALAQSSELESTHRFTALTTELHALFPTTTTSTPSGASAEEIIQALHSQFRAARLELEYLLPGEQPEGFDNTALLSMLLARLRQLVDSVKRQDDHIDQYHEQELSLRSQLSARVSAMQGLREKLASADVVIRTLEREVGDKDAGLRKLTTALESYRTEVSNLETLISRLDVEHTATLESAKQQLTDLHAAAESRIQEEMNNAVTIQGQAEERIRQGMENAASIQAQSEQQTVQAAAESELHDSLIRELDARLSCAIEAADALRGDLEELATAHAAETSALRALSTQRETDHGTSLALRDARVSELREEIERVNAALKGAHDTIATLGRRVRGLEIVVEGEKMRGREGVERIRGELRRVLEMGKGGTPGKGGASRGVRRALGLEINGGVEGVDGGLGAGVGEGVIEGPKVGVVRQGGLFDKELARRRSDSLGAGGEKKRRRYDSGLGFLDEEEGEGGRAL
ncbi:hypothetical protein VC83_04766 [Pseudogymnoascus destructans]|uniref:Uncharacterized protein n=2 Tax=Pseudogymnoascus destructans TaxID=655981 RepID=L8FT94_PSED2|nr:uncharacterized protein VC83_04766 [Pseudogymnoascus destructans]ELR03784.1 hypothetical protein GMDG_01313 [Pseudogymnoascus destructans 20631-21]OAF57567.1 hypothetical protein VC83_04766 [Pseudogymnoascus destructans]